MAVLSACHKACDSIRLQPNTTLGGPSFLPPKQSFFLPSSLPHLFLFRVQIVNLRSRPHARQSDSSQICRRRKPHRGSQYWGFRHFLVRPSCGSSAICMDLNSLYCSSFHHFHPRQELQCFCSNEERVH